MERLVTLTVLQVLIDKLFKKNCLTSADKTAIYQESAQVLTQITAENQSQQQLLDEALRYLHHLAVDDAA